jgi:hypothetical protein
MAKLNEAANRHDFDKLTDIDGFYADFQTDFKETKWWDNHRKIARHHLSEVDGQPTDVNLIDVLDMITDCVMAGMGRTGTVAPVLIDTDVLFRAFDNTVKMLKEQVVVEA